MVVIPRLPQLPVTQSLVLYFFVRTFIQDIELERKITVVCYVDLSQNMIPQASGR